ncbi:MAG: spondin domain-containing protein [Pseudomonadales bacterium]|nr:spondin domain-containing protein [Pseudomonadales bacterium]
MSFLKIDLRTAMVTAAIGTSMLLTGCGSSSSHDSTVDLRTYEVSVSNVTPNQPFSPIAVILHTSGYQAWVDGEPASTALELLAEQGDNSNVLSDASDHSAYLASDSGAGVIGPGNNESVQLEVDAQSGVSLSVISMLVNTNDAYTGINATSLAALESGESISYNAPVWDAGTEDNTEAAGTIPGPADGGEGFNASRSDSSDRVRFHSGIVSSQDGLSSSVLTAGHRFDNPAAVITITRLD